jgi:phage gp45-like
MGKDAVRSALAIGALLLLGAAPAALADQPADPGSQGHGHGHGHASSHAGSKTVMYVFKGTYAGGGDVVVDHGNAHVRKAGLVGTTVSFDLAGARIVVADNNSDGSKDLTDVMNDDRVVVKARLPRTDPPAQPFTAKQLVDQTHAPAV